MKKIILFISAGLFCIQGIAQSSVSETAKVTSVSEASRQQNAGATLINGKPYAQYKAEQDALKLQQQPVQRIKQPQEVSIAPGNIPARKQPVEENTLKGNETNLEAKVIDQPKTTEPAVVSKTTQVQLTEEQKAAQLEMIRSTSVRGVTEPEPAKTQPAGTNPVRTPAELEKLKADNEAAEKKSVKPAVENKGATTSPVQLSVGKTKTD